MEDNQQPKKSAKIAKWIKRYILISLSLFILFILIVSWPDHISRIGFDRNQTTQKDLNFILEARIDNHDLSKAYLTLTITSKNQNYETAEILKQKISPEGYRMGDDGAYMDFTGNLYDGLAIAEGTFEIETGIPYEFQSSSKPILHLSKSQTKNIPEIEYLFHLKVCTKSNECQQHKLDDKLAFEHIDEYVFYNPLEILSGYTFVFIVLPVLGLFVFVLLILIILHTRAEIEDKKECD